MTQERIELTASLEDYLEAIYILCQKEQHAHLTDIATQLKLSKPSAHRAVSQLRDAGMVMQEPYGQITLTELGHRHARSVLRRHMLVKRFLTQVLHVEESVAEDEACQIEHALSRETTNKLAEYLTGLLDAHEE